MSVQNSYIDGRDPSITNSNNGSSGSSSTATTTNSNSSVASTNKAGNPIAPSGNVDPETYLEWVYSLTPEQREEYKNNPDSFQANYNPDAFHAPNKNYSLWDYITGRAKREYEEAYNNWLAERDDTYIDRNKEAYERNGLNYASLAGTTTTNSLSGGTPDFGDPVGSATSLASSAMDLASGGMGLATEGVNLALGKEKVVGQQIGNFLASQGIPKATFDSAVYSMLGSDDSQNALHTIQQSFANQANSADNEAIRLNSEMLDYFVQNLQSQQGVSTDSDGNLSLTSLGQEYVNKNNRFIQGNLDFDYNQTMRHFNSQSASTNQNRQQFELERDKERYQYETTFVRAMEMADHQMRMKLNDEQYNTLRSGNYFYDAVMDNDQLNDKQRSAILLTRQFSQRSASKMLKSGLGMAQAVPGPLGTFSKILGTAL